MKSGSIADLTVLPQLKIKEQDKSAEIYFRVKPYDIDASGHVNNAVYLNWLEDLRIKLFSKMIRLEELMQDNIYLVVSSTNIKYKSPVFLYNRPNGKIILDKYYKGIWYLSAEFQVEEKVTTVAFQKCALLDGVNNRMIKDIIFSDEKNIYEVNKN